jgi:hypothetical protein
MSTKRKNNIHAQQWYWHGREMLESPAWCELSLSARRFLDRLHLEFMAHAGKNNGRLPITYDQLVEYGLHRHAIAPAIRELEALGFIEITQRGKASAGEHRHPNYFRLTDRPTKAEPATDDWKRIKTAEIARTIARAARQASAKPSKRPHQKSFSQCRKPSLEPVTETITGTAKFPVMETITTSPVMETITTSISRVGGRSGQNIRLVHGSS